MNRKENDNVLEDRFRDQKYTIGDFMDDILVVCPKCGGCAHVRLMERAEHSIFSELRVTCAGCGLNREEKVRGVVLGVERDPVDGYFSLPLWLVTGQGDRTLWLFNKQHLEYIEAFVHATHRMRGKNLPGCSNCSIISRLPRWIKKGSNRKQVLEMLRKLNDSLNDN